MENKKIIQLFRPCFDEKELKVLKEVFENGWIRF